MIWSRRLRMIDVEDLTEEKLLKLNIPKFDLVTIRGLIYYSTDYPIAADGMVAEYISKFLYLEKRKEIINIIGDDIFYKYFLVVYDAYIESLTKYDKNRRSDYLLKKIVNLIDKLNLKPFKYLAKREEDLLKLANKSEIFFLECKEIFNEKEYDEYISKLTMRSFNEEIVIL